VQFIHQIRDQQIENAFQRLVDSQLARSSRILLNDSIVEAAEEWNAFANLG
jgi:hypothetical protein